MDTIISYVENIFKALPKSNEVLQLKEEILLNMEEKYKELKEGGKSENEAIGIVISEFGNIDELLKEMNIDINEDNKKIIDLETAREYINKKSEVGPLIGLGVGLILIGVSIFLLLINLKEGNYIFHNISEDNISIIGVMGLLIFVVIAVGIFISTGMKFAKFKYIEEEGDFNLDFRTKGILEDEYNELSGNYVPIIIGVVTCILSAFPIFIGAMISDNAAGFGVSITLLMVAFAVYKFITFGNKTVGYRVLLKLDEYNVKKKQENKIVEAVGAIIWPIAVVVFLYFGFIHNAWNKSWIIFPIVGILFGGFAGLCNILQGKKN